jgi:hypothetical protein
MFRRKSPPGTQSERVHGAMAGTGLALLQRGHRRAAQEWFEQAGQKTKDPWLLEALSEIYLQLGDMAQSQRYSKRVPDRPLQPAFSFPLLVQGLDLTARPEQAVTDGGSSVAASGPLARAWRDGSKGGDVRAMCSMGIYMALTGRREEAGTCLGMAGNQLAKGPGDIPLSFGYLDAEAQVGMLSGLLEPLVDGLRLD